MVDRLSRNLRALALAALGCGMAAPCAARPSETALDDRLHQIVQSSATAPTYRHQLKQILRQRERQRLRRWKVKHHAMGRRAGKRTMSRLGRIAVPEPTLAYIPWNSGGEVRRADRAGVSVPPRALAQSLDITVSQPDAADEAARQAAAVNGGKAPASLPVAFGPEGTAFSEPVTITLPYDPGLVAAQGLREDDLKVHYWNHRQQRWEDLPSTVDRTQRTVSAQTTHFSVYQVLGPGGSGAIGVAAVDASFGLKAAYAFPNPARGQNAVTIRVQPGLADSVEVHVYDLSGREIHSSSDFRSLGAFDDGNGQGPQFTYEHVWNVSGVGSGVYTFVAVAHKAGEQDVRKTGKVGVVK